MRRMLQEVGLVALVFLLSVWQVQAQRKPKIKGSRNPVEVTGDLPEFHALRLADDLEVELKQAASPGYLLEVDDNLVDVLRLEVQDSTLVVSSFYDITASKRLRIVVYVRELTAVEASAGKVISEDPIVSDLVTVVARGNARINMRLRATWFDLLMEDNGGADLNVEADTLSVRMGGRTDANLYTVNTGMSVGLSDTATLTLEGLSARARVEAADGTLKAERMQADVLEARMEGGATARVFARNQAILWLSGQSRLYLYGPPQVELRQFSDRAELHKEPE